ncbi:MAG: chromate efflux transporter [Chitinophagales bacterium]|nr:chromate efflux transporter [Chitinophagales bacterium]
MKPRALIYLKDIFVLAITSFGGPQAHLALMHNILVKKRNYFTEEELLEVNALCQLLPGPASTQTIIVLTQKKWNTLMAILALLIWILPACAIMTALVMLFSSFAMTNQSTDFLIFVQPMAIGIIAYSGFTLAIKVVNNNTSLMIMMLSLLIAASFTTPWMFPLLIVGAAIVTNFTNKEKTIVNDEQEKIPWENSYFSIGLLVLLLILAGVLALLTKERPFILFENFFRFGTITFGGGSVLVPMMFEQFVKHRAYLTPNEFLSGLALSQALPGPSFAFATYAGGMAMKEHGASGELLGSIIGTVAIFLPGALLAFFIYPIWSFVKNYFFVRRALEGVNAAAVGLILSAAVILYTNIEFHFINIFVVIVTFLLLYFTSIKAPVLVCLALMAGVAYSYF